MLFHLLLYLTETSVVTAFKKALSAVKVKQNFIIEVVMRRVESQEKINTMVCMLQVQNIHYLTGHWTGYILMMLMMLLRIF